MSRPTPSEFLLARWLGLNQNTPVNKQHSKSTNQFTTTTTTADLAIFRQNNNNNNNNRSPSSLPSW